MGIFDDLKKKLDPAKIVSSMVLDTAKGAAEIVDQFVTNPEEREKINAALRKHELDKREQAMDADAAILADRQSARAMAGTHGKLQTRFALTFLISFLAMVIGEFVFVGLIVAWETSGTAPLSTWAQTLIASLLTGVLAYMVSMLKEVVGFLFGGSAGGDDASAALVESMRNSGNTAGATGEGGQNAKG